jgi:tetratricopeptide (TPR) repeat protein
MPSGAEPSAVVPRAGAGHHSGRDPRSADPAGALRTEGRFAEAAAVLDAEIDRCRREGRTTRLALARLARGVVAHDLGDLRRAETLLAEARAGLVAEQRPEAVAICAFDLAIVHHDLGELDDAVERLLEARAIFDSLDRTIEAAGCNQNLGVVLHAMGRDAESRARLRAARSTFAAVGLTDAVEECEHDLAVTSRPAPQVGRDIATCSAGRPSASGSQPPGRVPWRSAASRSAARIPAVSRPS